VQVQCLLLPGSLHLNPVALVLEQVLTDAGYEVVAGLNRTIVVLHKVRLHAQVLRFAGSPDGDPFQEPLIGFVPAGYLKGNHAMSSEQDYTAL